MEAEAFLEEIKDWENDIQNISVPDGIEVPGDFCPVCNHEDWGWQCESCEAFHKLDFDHGTEGVIVSKVVEGVLLIAFTEEI